MNALYGLMSSVYEVFPEFAYGVYLAFDAGEYHPQAPLLSPDAVTRPLIEELFTKYHAA